MQAIYCLVVASKTNDTAKRSNHCIFSSSIIIFHKWDWSQLRSTTPRKSNETTRMETCWLRHETFLKGELMMAMTAMSQKKVQDIMSRLWRRHETFLNGLSMGIMLMSDMMTKQRNNKCFLRECCWWLWHVTEEGAWSTWEWVGCKEDMKRFWMVCWWGWCWCLTWQIEGTMKRFWREWCWWWLWYPENAETWPMVEWLGGEGGRKLFWLFVDGDDVDV